MRLRTLKKLSKKAVGILKTHYGYDEGDKVFRAERGANYHGLKIKCNHKPKIHKNSYFPPSCPVCCDSHPLKGTHMTGEVSGYYEPEWDERTAFEELRNLVLWDSRAKSMTDEEWKRAMHITRTTPIDIQEYTAWMENGQ